MVFEFSGEVTMDTCVWVPRNGAWLEATIGSDTSEDLDSTCTCKTASGEEITVKRGDVLLREELDADGVQNLTGLRSDTPSPQPSPL